MSLPSAERASKRTRERTCTRCHETHPETLAHFRWQGAPNFRFRSRCRRCESTTALAYQTERRAIENGVERESELTWTPFSYGIPVELVAWLRGGPVRVAA